MQGTAKDLILALEGLEREKNIKRDDILKTIEDALVSAIAARCHMDCIITRNTQDFRESPVKALTTQEFLNL